MTTQYCILNFNISHNIHHNSLIHHESHTYIVHIHTHTSLTALFPGLPGWAGTRKAKPIWILLKQETVSGSGISWTICKSASRSRQITMPVPHHSFFYRPDALPAVQPTASYIHTHTRLTALCPGLPGWAGTRKVKPIWILLEQEIESGSGSGISWSCASLHLAPDR